jgi:DNA replication and repair protein RecF
MAFVRIETVSYRNLENGAVDIGAASVFLVGDNGQGKTNFLDALYTLCYGSSFRQSRDAEVAAYGSTAWSVKALSADGRDCAVIWNAGSKSIRIDGKSVMDRKNLVEANPAIVFCHDDMDFARGEPERRRFFFDQTAGLISAGYIDLLRSYKRVLKSRNAAIKETMTDVLEILDIQLATHGYALRNERIRLVNEFDRVFADSYESVSQLGQRISVSYKPSWAHDEGIDEIVTRLGKSRDRELAMGTTLSGPHRDKYIFEDERGDFSSRASIGQLRLMALTLRTAQAVYYSDRTGKKPMLLLDDVLLELDPEKRRRLMRDLPPAEQAVFTFLPGEPYRDYADDSTIIYWTDHGRFSRTQGS